MRKKLTILFILLLIVLAVYFMCLKDNTSRYIRSGTIQYKQALGWVNWHHAGTALTQKSYREFLQVNHTAADSFEFSYAQHNAINLGVSYFYAYYRETWKLRSGLNDDEANAAFIRIFASVSEGFEHMQGNIPMSLFADTRRSSFRDGDIMGNLISLGSVIYGIAADSLKAIAKPVSADQALEMYKNGERKKVYWQELKIDSSNNDVHIVQLQQLLKEIKHAKPFPGRKLHGGVKRGFE